MARGAVRRGPGRGALREVFPRLQTVGEARAIAANARTMLLDPFITQGEPEVIDSRDVILTEDEDDEEEKEEEEGGEGGSGGGRGAKSS